MGVYNGNDRRNDTIFGSKRDDYINGKGGDDRLYGNAGADRIYGGTGHDLLDGGDGEDNLQGESGNDTLFGGAGNDLLNGGFGNDALDGGTGDDSIYGYVGADRLTGGAGWDSFFFSSQNESNAANGVDRIEDFNSAEDILEFGGDLGWIDANTGASGVQSWEYVGTSRLGHELADGNGQFTLVYASGVTTMTFYRYGSTDAYMTIEFTGEYAPGSIHGLVNGLPVPPYDFLVW